MNKVCIPCLHHCRQFISCKEYCVIVGMALSTVLESYLTFIGYHSDRNFLEIAEAVYCLLLKNMTQARVLRWCVAPDRHSKNTPIETYTGSEFLAVKLL